MARNAGGLLNSAIWAIVEQSFHGGIKSVQPHNVLNKCIKADANSIIIQGKKLAFTSAYIVGFGKAVGCMVHPLAVALQTARPNCIKQGIISVPYGFNESMKAKDWYRIPSSANIQMYEGAKDNLPDENSFQTAERIVQLAKVLTEEDTLFVLISGGGSSLLPVPLAGLSLRDKAMITRNLSKSGANIHEMNTVRKALSAVKGGKLVASTRAQVISLIISDVIGDSLQIIASGPTSVDTDHPGDAVEILKKYGIQLDSNILAMVENNVPLDAQIFDNVYNFLIANNRTALQSVKEHISKQTHLVATPIVLTSELQGEASHVGEMLAMLGLNVLEYLVGSCNPVNVTSNCNELGIENGNIDQLLLTLNDVKESDDKSVCLIFGGETTVVVTGDGKGGRNQHLILSASVNLRKLSDAHRPTGSILLLSGGTDGIDGPTDAAGAMTYYAKSPNSSVQLQTSEAEEQSLDPQQYLANNNSYNYFSQLSNGCYHLKTGHTGTNVMDLVILFVSVRCFESAS